MVYPRLFRDRSWLPKIQIAISYFEQMLGRERPLAAVVRLHLEQLAAGLLARAHEAKAKSVRSLELLSRARHAVQPNRDV